MSVPRAVAAGQRRVVLFVVGLALVGVSAAIADATRSGIGRGDWLWAIPFTALLTASAYLLLNFRYRDEVEALDLFEAVLAPVIFVFAGWAVVAMVVVANAVAERLHRVPLVKAGFNIAQWAAAAGMGALLFSALRDGPTLTWHNIAALVCALVLIVVFNHLAFATVVALSQRQSVGQALAAVRSVILPGWIIGGGLNVAFGLLFVAAYQWDPAVTPLFFVPLFALHWASAAYAAARADEMRLQALHRASAMLGGRVDPLDAIDEFLGEVRSCFEAEAAELVLLDGHRRTVRRVPAGETPLHAALITSTLGCPPVLVSTSCETRSVDGSMGMVRLRLQRIMASASSARSGSDCSSKMFMRNQPSGRRTDTRLMRPASSLRRRSTSAMAASLLSSGVTTAGVKVSAGRR